MKEMDDLGKDNKKRKGKKYINLISKFPLETEVDGWNTVDAQLCVVMENWRNLTNDHRWVWWEGERNGEERDRELEKKT